MPRRPRPSGHFLLNALVRRSSRLTGTGLISISRMMDTSLGLPVRTQPKSTHHFPGHEGIAQRPVDGPQLPENRGPQDSPAILAERHWGETPSRRYVASVPVRPPPRPPDGTLSRRGFHMTHRTRPGRPARSPRRPGTPRREFSSTIVTPDAHPPTTRERTVALPPSIRTDRIHPPHNGYKHGYDGPGDLVSRESLPPAAPRTAP